MSGSLGLVNGSRSQYFKSLWRQGEHLVCIGTTTLNGAL